MSLELASSSFNVIPVSLTGPRKINTNLADADLVRNDSLLDIYAKRQNYSEVVPSIMTMNFITFATTDSVQTC